MQAQIGSRVETGWGHPGYPGQPGHILSWSSGSDSVCKIYPALTWILYWIACFNIKWCLHVIIKGVPLMNHLPGTKDSFEIIQNL